jgi:hypothetical protein
MHSAEPLFVTWLREVQKAFPEDTSLSEDIATLITAIDKNRSLSFEVSPKDRALFFSSSEQTSFLGMPGMRVFHAMLHMYSQRGTGSRCLAILRFIESRQMQQEQQRNNQHSVKMAFPLRLDNMVYHRTIAVCGFVVVSYILKYA